MCQATSKSCVCLFLHVCHLHNHEPLQNQVLIYCYMNLICPIMSHIKTIYLSIPTCISFAQSWATSKPYICLFLHVSRLPNHEPHQNHSYTHVCYLHNLKFGSKWGAEYLSETKWLLHIAAVIKTLCIIFHTYKWF